jgi:hypothetical protein
MYRRPVLPHSDNSDSLLTGDLWKRRGGVGTFPESPKIQRYCRARYKTMRLATDEFIRHVLPHGFHRIRHYGLKGLDQCAPVLPVSRPREKRTRRQERRQ